MTAAAVIPAAPWKVIKRGNQMGLRYVMVTDAKHRERLYEAPRSATGLVCESAVATAELIAAAPELRDLLRELRRHAESNGTTPRLRELCAETDALLARLESDQ